MDPATAAVIAAVVAAIASIVSASIVSQDRQKVKETHQQVTRNGGGNNPPTVLDKLADLKTSVDEVKEEQIKQGIKVDLLWQLKAKE